MDNIAFIGRVAEHVSRSAVTRAARVASNLVVSPTAGPSDDTTDQTVPLVTTQEGAQAQDDTETTWGDAAAPDVQLMDMPADPRDEVVPQDEFEKMVFRLDRKFLPDRGNNDAARSVWREPRRFSVRLRNFVLENLTSESYNSIFLLVTIGGTLVEVRVRDAYTKVTTPRLAGYPGEAFATPSVDLPALQSVELSFEKATEWRGSYLHLEKEHFTLEMWHTHTTSLNTILASHQEPLRSLVDASVAKMVTLEHRRDARRTLDHASKESFRISFQLEFQEIYDYELNFCNLKLLPPHETSFDEETTHEVQPDTKNAGTLHRASSRALIDSLLRSSTRSQLAPQNTLGTTAFTMFVAEEPGLSEEEMNRVFEGYEGPPRMRILVKAGGYNKWPLRLSMAFGKEALDFNNTMVFRGTATNLETTDLHVQITDSVRPKKKRQFESVVSLRDAIDTPQVAFQLRHEGKVVSTAVMTCGIPFRPKYRQTGQILDIDDDHMYLFVKLIKIDRLRPQPDTDEIDSFVEVAYNGASKNSTTVFNSISPHFQSELVFAVGVKDINHVTPPELEAMGPIIVDVWGSADIGNQHLGWTQMDLGEILATSPSNPGDGARAQTQTRRYYDCRKNKEMSYTTRVLSTKKQLILPSGGADHDGGASTLYLEVWTKPDLGDLELPLPSSVPSDPLSPEIPADIAGRIKPFIKTWKSVVGASSTAPEDCSCLAMDQRGRLLPYNFFVYPISPFSYISTVFDCFNFVRCISYCETDSFPSRRVPQWFSPDFIIKARRGTPLFHTLVLASLFMGIKVMTFVCLGTRHNDESFSWVLTIEPQKEKRHLPYVRLWDATDMTVYVLEPEILGSFALFEKLYGPPPTSSDSPASSGRLSAISEETEARSRRNSKVSDADTKRRPSSANLKVHFTAFNELSLEEMQRKYGVVSSATRNCPTGSHAMRIHVVRPQKNALPFKTINVMFNHHNVYANLCGSNHRSTRFQLTDKSQWYPLFPSKSDFDAVFPRSLVTSAPDLSTTSRITSLLYDDIMKGIQSLRFQMSTTAITSWVRQGSLVTFLERGMGLLSKLEGMDPETQEAKQEAAEFQEWRVALLALTPNYQKMRWIHITFNHANPKLIVQNLWNRVSFLQENDQTCIHIRPMPCDLMLTYVAVVAVTNLKRIEKRQLHLIEKLYEKEDTLLSSSLYASAA